MERVYKGTISKQGKNMIIGKIKYLSWALSYLYKRYILKRDIPFVGGLVLNDSCNLQCEQCKLANSGTNDMSFEQAKNALDELRSMELVNLAITGGEPYHWKSGDKKVDDLVKLARSKGFKALSIYTNGTYPIESSADTVFVSVDGLKETHNSLRGETFDTIMNNINNSSHRNICLNFNINSRNWKEIEAICKLAKDNIKIKGIFFQFHTPYYGIDDLFMTFDEKQVIAMNLIKLKKRYPILNSYSALKDYISNNWKRPSDICYTYAYGKAFKCCRSNANPQACEHCGYLGYIEVLNIIKLKPNAILSGLKYIS